MVPHNGANDSATSKTAAAAATVAESSSSGMGAKRGTGETATEVTSTSMTSAEEDEAEIIHLTDAESPETLDAGEDTDTNPAWRLYGKKKTVKKPAALLLYVFLITFLT